MVPSFSRHHSNCFAEYPVIILSAVSGSIRDVNHQYFPRYEVPKFISYLGPFDAPGVAITESAVAIGLQLYAGQDFPFYTSVEGQQLFPAYISKRFEKK